MSREHVCVVWHAAYEVDLGPHVFPTRKYRLIRDRLLAEGVLHPDDFVRPEPASDAQIGLAHAEEYLRRIREGALSPAELLALEVPFSDELRRAMWLCCGGTVLAARRALERGIAVHLGGGFHHAFADHGEGFCLLNDVAVGARVLLDEGLVRRAAVIDCDVHHGNGTAAIFAGDPAVFTYSMHQQNNYPARKPPSDLDAGLADGTGDEEYHALLSGHLETILERQRPEVAFYLAGADPYAEDQLGGLSLSIAGLEERDRLVLERMDQAGVATVVLLAGGYAARPEHTVEIHCNTVREACRVAGHA
jgi:acetoin utilization deacetylase AcuC-like enzyme